jgi:hypothetical protein
MCCLCIYFQGSSLCFSLIVSKLRVLHLDLWFTLSYFLYKARDVGGLVSVFCMLVSSFPNTIYWKAFPFSNVCFWCHCWKLDGHSCVDFLWDTILFHWCTCLFWCHCHFVFVTVAL